MTHPAVPNRDVHDPTAACKPWHCAFHNVDENDRAYLFCGECGHAFVTSAELLDAHNALAAEVLGLAPETDAEEVLVCPFCAHNL